LKKHQITISVLLISIILVLSALPVHAQATDPQWPQPAYDQEQSGQSPYLGPQKNNSKWNYTIEDGYMSQIDSSPVIDAEGNIYFVASYFTEPEPLGEIGALEQQPQTPLNNLYALNPDGTLKWITPVTSTWQAGPCALGPEGNIYLPGSVGWYPEQNAILYAFDSDGTPIWSFSDPLGKTPNFMNPVVTSDGTIYIAGNRIPPVCDNGVYWAISSTGVALWSFLPSTTRNQIRGYALDGAGVSYLGVEQESAVLGGSNGFSNNDDAMLYAVDPEGNEKWNLNLELPVIPDTIRRVEVISPVVGPTGMIYLMVQALFIPYDDNGGDNQEGDIETQLLEPVVLESDENLEPGENNLLPEVIERNFIFAVNPTGTTEWIYELPNCNGVDGLAVAADGTIYFTSVIGDLPDTFSAPAESLQVAINSPQIANNIQPPRSILFALNPDGTLKWNYTSENDIPFTKPVIGSDGTIYTVNLGPGGDGVGGGKENLQVELSNQETNPEPVALARLFAFNPDGTIKWTLDDIASNFPVAIAQDGTMYISGTRPKPGPLNSENGQITTTEQEPDQLTTSELEVEPVNQGVLYAIKGQVSQLYLQVTSSNNNPTLGEVITLTFKVGNRALDDALGTVFQWYLPAGLELVGNPWSDTDRQPVYDPLTRTITWYLGSVPYGDPYLWANVRTLTTGAITIQAYLQTLTYNPDIEENPLVITVNAQSQPGTITQALTTVKIVGMQSTGIPLSGIILALLFLMGGLITTRRK